MTSERVARRRERIAAAGWRTIQVELDPIALQALEALQRRDGGSIRDTIASALMSAAMLRKASRPNRV